MGQGSDSTHSIFPFKPDRDIKQDQGQGTENGHDGIPAQFCADFWPDFLYRQDKFCPVLRDRFREGIRHFIHKIPGKIFRFILHTWQAHGNIGFITKVFDFCLAEIKRLPINHY